MSGYANQGIQGQNPHVYIDVLVIFWQDNLLLQIELVYLILGLKPEFWIKFIVTFFIRYLKKRSKEMLGEHYDLFFTRTQMAGT